MLYIYVRIACILYNLFQTSLVITANTKRLPAIAMDMTLHMSKLPSRIANSDAVKRLSANLSNGMITTVG